MKVHSWVNLTQDYLILKIFQSSHFQFHQWEYSCQIHCSLAVSSVSKTWRQPSELTADSTPPNVAHPYEGKPSPADARATNTTKSFIYDSFKAVYLFKMPRSWKMFRIYIPERYLTISRHFLRIVNWKHLCGWVWTNITNLHYKSSNVK